MTEKSHKDGARGEEGDLDYEKDGELAPLRGVGKLAS
jgi:hypothetical protein